MRLGKRNHEPPAEADWTPMIDMTFQLIAFFMVLINFSQSEQNDRVTLPASELAKPAETPLEFPIVVHLTSADTVEIGGSVVNLDALRSQLSAELALLNLEGKTAADANVVLRGHATIPGGRVQEVIKRFQDIGFQRFALRAKEELP
ncbi:MAG: biopolymer transporter ExbD [Pirellulaceae bacterium]|nr:biopolymer transporter ExbD [Pirellulaceae bacterium]